MASIRVTHTLADLEADLTRIATTTKPRAAALVRRNAVEGNRLAKELARQSAGAHGKHYHKAFSAEAITPLVWEYGPDSAKPQGGMSFEYGSRNQPPHLDLNRSADVQGPRFERSVGEMVDGLFW